MRNFTLFLILLSIKTICYSQVFTNVAPALGVDNAAIKDGGVAWADLNNDGCLDLIINTADNNVNNRTRLYFSDCNLPNPTFTDVTATHALGLQLARTERSISVGDYNNDGNLDFCRNSSRRIEVYLNRGPGAVPAYSFGDAIQNPNFLITNIANGMNSEGFGWMDYDSDGWLDLIVENDNFGIDIFRNPADGSANFVHATPNANTLGLPVGTGLGAGGGDYMTLCDYDDDGYVDILARKTNEPDLWRNVGGTFIANMTFNQLTSNNPKGGVLFCDFDNDGDFDLFWTNYGVNEIFEQTGLNTGTFVATNQPQQSLGAAIPNNIDGCSCGDVDNDGDLDLFLGGDNASAFLFLNTGVGFNFVQDNRGINVGGNTEGNVFADYDNDGDLDLYINRQNGANELWRNNLNNNNFLKVEVKKNVGGGILRDDLGATIVLKDCAGTILGGIRQVSSVKGHGSNDPAVVHFGLPLGNNIPYLVEVHYTTLNGVRTVLDSVVVPAALPNQTMTMVAPSGAGLLDGCLILLDINFLNFDVTKSTNEVAIEWTIESEEQIDFFSVERSTDGTNWESVATVKGNTTTGLAAYQTVDDMPHRGISYYRLKCVSPDKAPTFSSIKVVEFNALNQDFVTIYPNPVSNQFNLKSEKGAIEPIEIYNAIGQSVTPNIYVTKLNEQHAIIDVSNLSSGWYLLKTKHFIRRFEKL